MLLVFTKSNSELGPSNIILAPLFSKFTFPFATSIVYVVLSAILISPISPALGSLIVKLAFICIFVFIAFNNATLIVFSVFIIKVPP